MLQDWENAPNTYIIKKGMSGSISEYVYCKYPKVSYGTSKIDSGPSRAYTGK